MGSNSREASSPPINVHVSGLEASKEGKIAAGHFTNNITNVYHGSLKLLPEEKEACLRSLSFLNIDSRQQDIASPHRDTCNWLFQTTQFQQWRDRSDLSSHNGLLWIKGKPGAGKSTLMKHTLDHCRETFKDHVIAAYFFNARGDSLEKTPLGMLRSLTYQLLDQDPLSYERFIPIFRDKQKKHKSWEWREGELQKFLLSETKMCQSTPLLLLIDALDECNEPEVRKVVEFLELLSIYAIDANVSLNICLSSRHYPSVSMKKRLELVVEKRKEHDGDISIYVRDKLAERDEEIEKSILDKASGIFMWVILVVAMLNQAHDHGQVEAMHQKLREVPPDLEEIFRTLLNKDSPNKDETILMLQCVLFSRRPLKPEELYFATIAGTDTPKLGAWNRSKVTSDVIRRRITGSSKGLVEIRKGREETVQFIHESVNDFLLRNKRLETLDSGLELNATGASHDRLKACCMSYLMIKELPSAVDKSHVKELRFSYPFLEYASTYVLDHAEEAQARCIVQTDFVRCLQKPHGEFERLRRFHNAFEAYPNLGCSRGVSLLYTLSLHGYDELVKIVLLEKGADVNAQGGVYGNALQAASLDENEEVVTMLLEKGADVNAQCGLWGNALQAASEGGRNRTVAILLEKGADVNVQGGVFGNALQAAAANEEEGIVAILLDKGADVNAQGGLYGNALQAASTGQKEEIVAMLLEKGADINAQGGVLGNALQAASTGQKEEIVAMLLEKGADINAQGGVFGNALQAAAFREEKEIMEMLLEKGADINAQGGVVGNALPAALVGEEEETVTILLQKGADINIQGGVFGNALQEASAKGEEEVVAMLLDKGADVNAQGGFYGNALQVAAAKGEEEIVAILLDKGADINAQGGFYGNALQAASEGKEEMVTMLLTKGADVNAQGGFCGNALQAAAAKGEEGIVAKLLDKGADVNAQGGFYGNALQAAAAKGEEEIIAILLDKGADVNAQGGFYGNALQAAAAKEEEGIVAILLDKGADVNAQGGFYGNALQAAAAKEEEGIVAILLDKGADVNAQGGLYGNALQAAAGEGDEEIVAILLDKGANVNAQGGLYGNALQATIVRGEEKIVMLLLDKGVDVNAQGGLFGNALQAALVLGEDQMIEILLENGADVNAQGGIFGNTQQATLVDGKNEEIVGILLEKGADVNHPQWRTVLDRQLSTAHHLTKFIVLIVTTFFVELWNQLFEKLSPKNN